MRIGLGLGAIITIGLFFNIIRIPLDWKTFLVLSLIIPLFYLLRNIKDKKFNFSFKITKTDLVILVMLCIFSATLFMYAKGAFSYPWLEDDDSWAHALGVKYVSVERKVFADKPLRYIDPYPPSYDMLLGILHQTNNSMYWTLKFFNALIISLGIIFFFFFSKELAGKNKALFSTFALASIPAFLSHFIWTIALSIPLYFVSFYAVERIKYDKKWFLVASVVIASALTVSPTHSTYFGIFFAVYYLTKIILEKNLLLYHAAAGLLGMLLSFVLWWLPAILKHGLKGTLIGIGTNPDVTSVLNIAGTADRIYNIKDFVIAQTTNMINNPIGIGFIVSLLVVLALISIVYKYRNEIWHYRLAILILFLVISSISLTFLSETYVKRVQRGIGPEKKGTVPFSELLLDQTFHISTLLIMIFVFVSLIVIHYKKPDLIDKNIVLVLAWLIVAFFAVNAGPFYYKLSPFRAWSVLAIPIAIISSEGLWFLFSLFKSFKIPTVIVLIVVIIGIIITSAYQKYAVNTAQWGYGGFWTSTDEVIGYIWIKDNLPKNSKVFNFVNNGPILGMDMYTCHWCSSIQDYQRNGFNQTVEKNHEWLIKEKYEYIAIDGQTARKFGANETNSKIRGFVNSNKFKPVYNNNGIIVFQIV